MQKEKNDWPEDDVIELGEVSVDTHGSLFGHTFDGGWGIKLP